MKVKIIVILALCIGLAAFTKSIEQDDSMRSEYLRDVTKTKEKTLEMLEALRTSSDGNIRNQYRELRNQFKTIEFLIAEIDQEFYLKKINGAPLPKLEKHVPDIRVLQPKGFQVIDELIGDTATLEELKYQVEKLSLAFEELESLHTSMQFSSDLYLNAVQHQLLRIYTLGITGFDTPGSLSGISDAVNSLKGIRHYLTFCSRSKTEKFVELLNQNISYLQENSDFNTFNRAAYYKVLWQPLYSELVTSLRPLLGNINFFAFTRELNMQEDELFTESIFNKQAFLDFSTQDYTDVTIALGKRIFFDVSLSSNGRMACSSCHNPSKGFSDGRTKSLASDGKSTLTRNSPGLVNSLYTKAHFYDLRAEHLSQQFEHVIFSEDEFNTSLIEILKKLKQSDYKELFIHAFPSHRAKPVNPYTFKVALSAYLASLTSYNSNFDQYMRGESKEISDSVLKGYNLFMGKAACATCHFPPSFAGLVPPYFNDSESEVLGVPIDTMYTTMDTDPGRYGNKKPKEHVDFYQNSFKTTTVRNVSKTGPYMHNGVFETLHQVMEFYNNGGGIGHGFDIPNQTLAGDSLNLTTTETAFIVEFLEALEEDVN